ncbi:MAG: tol-pal system protein YbgF [Thermoanaerobaculia bacterium]|nr:tol-pal system protein YbgF [Thermoanaerobaculia bacterium]
MSRRGGTAVALLALALAGCSATAPPFGRGPRDGGDVAEMKRRIVELERQARVAQVEIERLRRQVAELRAGSPAGRPGPGSAPQGEAASPPPADPEEVDPPQPVDREPPVESSEIALENRLEEPAVRATPPAAAEAAPGPPAIAPVSAEAQALYDRGYTLYHQSRPADAEATFEEFIRRHGDTELADNAQYWIGEARFARRDVPGALAAFRETIERFPEGNKVPDALLRAGDCMAELGDEEGARALYAEVARLYPNTAAAAMAEERSAKLP